MIRIRRALVLAVALLPALACQDSSDATAGVAADIAVRGVTVLSPYDGSEAQNQTVLVEGERIVAILGDAESVVPEGAQTVDGAGLFLMPGLWDFHTHLSFADPNAAPLMVTQGVTGARDLGGFLEDIDRLRDRIASGELIGPRIVRAGPTLNGVANGTFHRVIDTPEAAREAVTDLAGTGVSTSSRRTTRQNESPTSPCSTPLLQRGSM